MIRKQTKAVQLEQIAYLFQFIIEAIKINLNAVVTYLGRLNGVINIHRVSIFVHIKLVKWQG